MNTNERFMEAIRTLGEVRQRIDTGIITLKSGTTNQLAIDALTAMQEECDAVFARIEAADTLTDPTADFQRFRDAVKTEHAELLNINLRKRLDMPMGSPPWYALFSLATLTELAFRTLDPYLNEPLYDPSLPHLDEFLESLK